MSKSSFVDDAVDDHEDDYDDFAREVVVKVNSENTPSSEVGKDTTMKMANGLAGSSPVVENKSDAMLGNASNISTNQSSPKAVPLQIVSFILTYSFFIKCSVRLFSGFLAVALRISYGQNFMFLSNSYHYRMWKRNKIKHLELLLVTLRFVLYTLAF